MTDNAKLYYALPRRASTLVEHISCPICGSYEGDIVSCPECGWDSDKMRVASFAEEPVLVGVMTDYGAKMDLTDEEKDILSRRSKPQFLIDDDDEYQDQLELMWAKDEIRNR